MALDLSSLCLFGVRMSRRKKKFNDQKYDICSSLELAALTHQHCSDLASLPEVKEVINLFLEELKCKLSNLEAVFIKNLGAFSPKLLAPKKSLQHFATKERRTISSRATIRFRFEPEIKTLIKIIEKTYDSKNDK